MASTAYATKGQRFAFTVQTAMETLNTTSPKDVFCDGEIKVESAQSDSITPDIAYVDSNETAKPVIFSQAVEDALSCSCHIRMAAAAAGTPFLVSAFESGGYTVATPSADSTIATYTSVTSFTTTDSATDAAGEFRTIQLSDGRFVPMLFSADGAAGAITPLHALPAATEAGKAIKKTWTITPGQPGPVPANKFLSGFYADKANPADRIKALKGMFLSSVGDIVIEPGTLPKLDLTFGAADIAESTTTVLMSTANDFADAIPIKITDSTLVFFANYSASGAIAGAYQKLIKATIKLNKTAKIIPGMGGADCVNNMQGAMTENGIAEIVLEMLWDADKITDWEGTNTDKMISIIQPSSAVTIPAWNFTVPKAHVKMKPEVDKSGNVIKMNVTYSPNPPAMASVTTVNAQQNQPWYFGWSDRSA